MKVKRFRNPREVKAPLLNVQDIRALRQDCMRNREPVMMNTATGGLGMENCCHSNMF